MKEGWVQPAGDSKLFFKPSEPKSSQAKNESKTDKKDLLLSVKRILTSVIGKERIGKLGIVKDAVKEEVLSRLETLSTDQEAADYLREMLSKKHFLGETTANEIAALLKSYYAEFKKTSALQDILAEKFGPSYKVLDENNQNKFEDETIRLLVNDKTITFLTAGNPENGFYNTIAELGLSKDSMNQFSQEINNALIEQCTKISRQELSGKTPEEFEKMQEKVRQAFNVILKSFGAAALKRGSYEEHIDSKVVARKDSNAENAAGFVMNIKGAYVEGGRSCSKCIDGQICTSHARELLDTLKTFCLGKEESKKYTLDQFQTAFAELEKQPDLASKIGGLTGIAYSVNSEHTKFAELSFKPEAVFEMVSEYAKEQTLKSGEDISKKEELFQMADTTLHNFYRAELVAGGTDTINKIIEIDPDHKAKGSDLGIQEANEMLIETAEKLKEAISAIRNLRKELESSKDLAFRKSKALEIVDIATQNKEKIEILSKLLGGKTGVLEVMKDELKPVYTEFVRETDQNYLREILFHEEIAPLEELKNSCITKEFSEWKQKHAKDIEDMRYVIDFLQKNDFNKSSKGYWSDQFKKQSRAFWQTSGLTQPATLTEEVELENMFHGLNSKEIRLLEETIRMHHWEAEHWNKRIVEVRRAYY